jgi:hypothetical protein
MMLPKMHRRYSHQASSNCKTTGMQAISRSVGSASAHDAAACAAIYRGPKAHEWLVLEHDGQVIGFAYGHALHRVPSYQ